MLFIGCHVGFHRDTQILGSLEEALKYHANTFMFYTGAPQNTSRYPIEDGLTLKALMKMKEENINYAKVVVHAPYIINLCNEDNFSFSVRFLTEELERVNALGIKYLVLHPGSHVGLGISKGIQNIAKGINLVFQNLGRNNQVTILLETMAGKGSEVGSTLEEIQKIIEEVEDQSHIGVCLDTCHLHDAGYDMSNFDTFLEEFDQVIGIHKIGCVHINDSKNELSSHKDRHENIGLGKIGFPNLLKIIYHDKLKDVPKILETPYIDKKYPPYQQEIEMIRKKTFDKDFIQNVIKESTTS